MGASARFLSVSAIQRMFGIGFPLGTMTVNIVGSLIMGVIATYVLEREAEAVAPLIMIGMLGGFTTFSSFSLDAVGLFDRGQIGAAALYVGGSVALSIAALAVGVALAKAIWV